MRILRKYVATFLKYGTLISSLGLIVSTVIQIYARFYMESAPSWTEESARFFFIYAMAFASGLAMKDGFYVHFDVFFNRLGKQLQRWVTHFISLLTIVLFMVLMLYGIQFVLQGLPERSPSLEVPMSIAFASMILMGLSVSFFALLDFLKTLKKQKH